MSEAELPNLPPAVASRKRSMQRVMSLIAIIVCCGFFACAGCCFLFLLLFGPKNIETPEGAEAVRTRIIDWTLPPGFIGKSGMTFDNIAFLMEVARFEQKEGRGLIVIGQLKYKFPSPTSDRQLQEILEKVAPTLKKIDLQEVETRTSAINGATATFEVGRGEDRASTTRCHRIVGHFRGKAGDAVMILECEQDFLTDQEINDFLDSIK